MAKGEVHAQAVTLARGTNGSHTRYLRRSRAPLCLPPQQLLFWRGGVLKTRKREAEGGEGARTRNRGGR